MTQTQIKKLMLEGETFRTLAVFSDEYGTPIPFSVRLAQTSNPLFDGTVSDAASVLNEKQRIWDARVEQAKKFKELEEKLRSAGSVASLDQAINEINLLAQQHQQVTSHGQELSSIVQAYQTVIASLGRATGAYGALKDALKIIESQGKIFNGNQYGFANRDLGRIAQNPGGVLTIPVFAAQYDLVLYRQAHPERQDVGNGLALCEIGYTSAALEPGAKSKIPLIRRSDKVQAYPNAIHVTVAGHFDPVKDGSPENASIETSYNDQETRELAVQPGSTGRRTIFGLVEDTEAGKPEIAGAVELLYSLEQITRMVGEDAYEKKGFISIDMAEQALQNMIIERAENPKLFVPPAFATMALFGAHTWPGFIERLNQRAGREVIEMRLEPAQAYSNPANS